MIADSIKPESMVRTRRTQSERSEAMRARLGLAAYETAAQGGLKALRMRSVAQAAGVSQGAVLHHFPDKNAVILAALEQALELARADSAVHLESAPNGAEASLRAMLAEFRAFFYSDRFWVAMGITIEASKDAALYPEVRRLVARLRKPIYAVWEERLCANGWSAQKAALTVRAATALISGSAVRRFWAQPDALTGQIEAEWIAERLAKRRD
jgi:AcrR family transcriptional regulator